MATEKLSEDNSAIKQHCLDLLRQMLGANKDFRPGQWEAIEAVAVYGKRGLVIQPTGWGKSLVYFLATRLLREQEAGPTLLISPLLSLMRNQIDMANRIGIQAQTINSGNRQDWEKAEQSLLNNTCDIVLISPERLGSEHFQKHLLPRISAAMGLIVVDEAHCISDWGHDFRPDYRRIGRLLRSVPKEIPVLGTTATANQRVIADIQSQFGSSLEVFRGPLARESLRLQNLFVGSRAERLAWLTENLPKFKGSGIIYCQTAHDTLIVSQWSKKHGFKAEAYHAKDESEINRPVLEAAFMENKIDILVATVALGMGFDKPDVAFVIHFQRPKSVIEYYQQVGRAGRSLDRAYGILLCGDEDEDIQKFLINNAMPSNKAFDAVLGTLSPEKGTSVDEMMREANYAGGAIRQALRLLEVDGAVERCMEGNDSIYRLTGRKWQPDNAQIKKFIDLRWKEWYEINRYVHYKGCLMEYLQRSLGDASAHRCGLCANCQNKGFSPDVSPTDVIEAEDFLNELTIVIKPKEKAPSGLLPTGKVVPTYLRNETGQSLSYYGDAGWGRLVKEGKYINEQFSDELAEAAAHLIMHRWKPSPAPKWVTAIPSKRRPALVADIARRIADRLGIPFHPVLVRNSDAPEQKTMQNEVMQARNVLDSLSLNTPLPAGPLLLIDDIIDSGWTLTMAGYLLRKNSSGPVYPFTLAQASKRLVNK